jgi:hypothetical protein
VFETGDLDLGVPDQRKTAYKLALRIGDSGLRTLTNTFTVEGSEDKGRTWKALGRMAINPDEDENEIHFRLSGTNLRFRISLTTSDYPFEWEELTVRARISGEQVVRGADK